MKRCFQQRIAVTMMLLPLLLLGTALAGESPRKSASRQRGAPTSSEPQLKIVVGGGATLEFVETPLDDVIELLKSHEIPFQTAPPPDFRVRGGPTTAQERIEEALGEPTTLEFIETPLQDVVNYLKHLHDIEIQLDLRALEDVGIGSDTPITRNLKGISLRSALRLMLLELDLRYVVRDEVLLITTPSEIGEQPVTRVYCLAPLLDFRESADELAEKLESVFQPVDDQATRLQITPHRQTFVVRGNTGQHETLESLLECLHCAVGQRNCAQSCRCRSTSGGINRFERIVRSPAESKIEAALNDPTQLEFIETPLQDVIDFLKDMHDIEIQIDNRALEDVGIGSDTPITMSLKGVSLRSALRLMLRQLDLTFVIRDEVLLITPIDFSDAISTRVYSVAELLDFGEPADELAETLQIAIAGREGPPAPVPVGEAKKKEGRAKLRIVPYRNAIIVVGSSSEHEMLVRLLHDLSLGLQGRTISPAVPEKASASGTKPSRQRARKPRSKRRDKADDEEKPDKPGVVDDPFAGGADDKDPFGGGGGADSDPFGGGGDDEDPFGPSKEDRNDDPFGATDGEDPFG